MDRHADSPSAPHTRADSLGVLLVNLGTPDAPTAFALRRYLAEFLSDPDVVTLPRILWLPLLHCLVLRTRPAKSAEAYARIWTRAGSPLLVNSQALADKLEAALGSGCKLALGMRYGNPSLSSALAALKKTGVARVLVLPLYPQYAAATTGSTLKAVDRALKRLGWSSAVTAIRDYHDRPAYITALAESVQEHWAEHGRGQKLIVSFHGIPKQISDGGDPYADQCDGTARLLAGRLGLKEGEWRLTFQSRFGPAEWLKPYTEEALIECAAQGLTRVDVICPGFAADCLETLEEIALRYADSFRAAGGKELCYIPALNARDAHVRALAELVLQKQRERA
ncbi:MAG TPA: ferrochelatase [Gammaproteobacteria bacterium]|nr:ferrochelatase [Gammaproteobacteria bacterium]